MRTSKSLRLSAVSSLAAAILVGLGCADGPYELAPAGGSVTIGGQPFAAGKVMFAPAAQAGSADAGKPAFGELQPDGSFALTTYKTRDGAIVGEHWVTILASSSRSDELAVEPVPAVEWPANVPKFAQVRVPQKLTVVAGEQNQFAIELTPQDITRFGRPE